LSHLNLTSGQAPSPASAAGSSDCPTGRFTFCQYWPSATWWATYCSGELLDVYPTRNLAEGYCSFMNGRAA
jgi:hypothetical protein